jgi:hypothetical protein
MDHLATIGDKKRRRALFQLRADAERRRLIRQKKGELPTEEEELDLLKRLSIPVVEPRDWLPDREVPIGAVGAYETYEVEGVPKEVIPQIVKMLEKKKMIPTAANIQNGYQEWMRELENTSE